MFKGVYTLHYISKCTFHYSLKLLLSVWPALTLADVHCFTVFSAGISFSLCLSKIYFTFNPSSETDQRPPPSKGLWQHESLWLYLKLNSVIKSFRKNPLIKTPKPTGDVCVFSIYRDEEIKAWEKSTHLFQVSQLKENWPTPYLPLCFYQLCFYIMFLPITSIWNVCNKVANRQNGILLFWGSAIQKC